MPRSLAIETSGRTGSIATVLDGRVLAEEQFAHGLQHAAQILPIIDRMCRARDWSPRDVDELYLSIGPGSFTGLRIGVTVAKTMSFAIGVKLVAVPTVRVLLANAPAEAREMIIVLDAKRRQIFTARFQRDDSGQWLDREPAHLDDLPSMLSRARRPVHLLGEGIPYHEAEFDRNDPQIVVTPPDLWRARASSVAQIGSEMARRGEFADADRLVPIYIRLPEAEEKRLAEEGRTSR
jgi:tRNA threonylcarbamoyladenosine biosynthesis protein TsaB